MPEQDPSAENQLNYLLSDFNTRLRESEERNRAIKERVSLLSQNLISSREELDKELELIKSDTAKIKKELEKLKSLTANIIDETDKFVKKDEMILIERMLKDFQPLEFARMKDIEELINKKLNIKSENSLEKETKTEKMIKKISGTKGSDLE